MNRPMILYRLSLFAALAMLIAPSTLGVAVEPAASFVSEFQAIDEYVQNEMDRSASPGLAYAIVHDDRIVYMNALGIADPSGRAVTPQTPFIVGSVGKTFTALAIRQLVEAGRVDPNAPTQKYIPWFRVVDQQASAQITVQNLLDHKSGIPNRAGNQRYQLDERYTLEDLVRRVETVQLNRAPGTTFEYSNVNFLVLGLIVEKVTGQSYAEYVQEHILVPLEMRQTYFDEQDAQGNGLAVGYQNWYGLFMPIRAPYPRGMQPAGYGISTAQDLGHYLVAYLNEGTYRGASIITPGAKATANMASDSYCDIYWNKRRLDPNIMEGQSGGTLNYNADLLIIPSDKWGVVVLMNSRAMLDDLVPTVTAASIAEGVARRIKQWETPSSAPLTFQQWYLFIDAILLMLVAFGMFEIVRVWRWHKTIRVLSVNQSRGGGAIAIDFAVALGLLAIPIAQGLSLDYFLVATPDIAIVVFGVAIILFVVAVARVTILIASRRKTAKTERVRKLEQIVGERQSP